jgi:hypothetical protein
MLVKRIGHENMEGEKIKANKTAGEKTLMSTFFRKSDEFQVSLENGTEIRKGGSILVV